VSVLVVEPLTYAEAARIVREGGVVKDKSYRKFPIGQEWGRFLRAKRLAGRRPTTIDSYETVGRLFTLRHADFDSLEPFAEKETGPELVLDFLDYHWGESDEDTVIQRTAVLRSFFEWAYRVDRISADPMRKIEKHRRKRSGPRRERIPTGPLHRLISGNADRDACGLLLLGRLALRREDLRMLQVADIDLTRDELHLRHAKGGEEHVLPIAFPEVRDSLYRHIQVESREPLEYLIYPKTECTRPFSTSGIDGWFKRCCTRAGVVGYTMHQLRHAAADDYYEASGGDKSGAQMLLRHANSDTTEEYLHRSLVDDLRQRIVQLTSTKGSGADTAT
jgi:integrase